MAKLKNLEELFHHQLRDIYNAETQLIDALPKMQEKAATDELRKAISEHLEVTKKQKQRLEEVGRSIGLDDLSGETCDAMRGLIREANKLISEDADDEVRDAGIISDAQRIEHYEISAYGTLAHYARSLNHGEAAEKLQQTLEEESAADEKLNEIAIKNINRKAQRS